MTPVRAALRLVPPAYRRRLRAALRPGPAPLQGHYAIPLPEPVGYCYIRKNACSAFKRLIVATSPHAPRADDARLSFFDRHHRLDWEGAEACARRVFVIRDPLERIASGYLNQVVMRLDEPYPVLADSVAAVAGRARAELSFADFVERYLGSEDFARVDVHFAPQVAHLAPLAYTHVLHAPSLAADAAQVFGPELAAAHFARPVNPSADLSTAALPRAWAIPAGELRRRLDAEGRLPRKADLLAGPPAARLAAIYAADLALYARYLAARAADPGRPPALDMRGHDFAAHYSHNPGPAPRGRR